MPYWVEQTEGPIVDEINAIVGNYSCDEMGAPEAWRRLSKIFLDVRTSSTPPEFHFSKERGERHLCYMITTWFPFYANMWFSGTRDRCYGMARHLNQRYPGCRFSVGYEY